MTPQMIDTLLILIAVITGSSIVGVMGYCFYRVWKEETKSHSITLTILIILVSAGAMCLFLPHFIDQAVDNDWGIIRIITHKIWIKIFALISLFLGLFMGKSTIKEMLAGTIEVVNEVGPSYFYNREKQPIEFWFYSCFFLALSAFACGMGVVGILIN